MATRDSPDPEARSRQAQVGSAESLGGLLSDYLAVIIRLHQQQPSFREVVKQLAGAVNSVNNLRARALVHVWRSLRESHEPE